MSSIVLLAHPRQCTQEQFKESLKELTDSKSATSNLPTILPEIDASQVKQCVVGPNHLAFLMQDGRICRVAFHVNSERSSSAPVKEQSSDDEVSRPSCAKKPTVMPSTTAGDSTSHSEHTMTLSGEALNSLSGTLGRWTHRVNVSSAALSGTTSSTSSSVLASRAAISRGRGRIIRATRGRAGTEWLSSRAVIPASAVPEELISQAQVVLQGKSRQVIIRELQKTSLDVNLAVNNLLSHDDDDPEDQEEEQYMQETYIPGEDLMSIFEAGIPGDEPFVVQRDTIFPEDLIYNPSYNRVDAANRASAQTESTTRDESSSKDLTSSRIRDRWWGMLMMEGKDKPTAKSIPSAKPKSTKTTDTAHRFGEIEWWDCEQEDNDLVKFTEIASLHSELIAISDGGFLHQWQWNSMSSPSAKSNEHTHPRSAEMKLTTEERVTKIAACSIRATILTESGKLATWLDNKLAAVCQKLEHPVQLFSELKGHPVNQLSVCELYSCVQLSNGNLYWWGVFPYEQREKILEKVKTKAKKSAIAGSSHIKPGTLVCIRSCPLYYPGAIGFTTVKGEPRVGELLDKAWSISEKCRFKIIDPYNNELDFTPEEPMEEGAAKSEESETKSLVVDTRKRKFVEETEKDYMEEEWCLQDVVFVEEVENVAVGEVLKVDGAYAMVHFTTKCLSSNKEDKKPDFDLMLKESIIRRKDELQIVKWTTPPKMPECYQKVPKQLILSNSFKVLAMSPTEKGIHALLKSSTMLRYTIFSLASSRAEAGGVLQPEPASFLSKPIPSDTKLLKSSLDSVVLLQDPNGCLYPVVKDSVGGIQNPTWSNLSSLICFASGSKKSATTDLAINILIMKDGELLQHIIRCDVESVKEYVKSMEENEELLRNAVSCKSDGNRNILHVCVSSCQPTSAKGSGLRRASQQDETKDDVYEPWMPLFDGLSCLEVLLKSPQLFKHLDQLLSQKDALGYTPFMTAVRIRAYGAALKLYEMIAKISTENGTSEQNKEQFMSMICPVGTDPDMSPLHMLCCNDTCSFTWTGTKHINQDIFECKTCGLVEQLCCCTECAQVCHIGHECKLKRTSPTAYCDCWEKCPCKSLVPGDQAQRVDLLHHLVDETDLTMQPNKKGQHILLFLVQTVARQANEQMQYMPNRMSSNDSSKQRTGAGRSRVRSQTPPLDHELEPPKFAQISLTYILRNWKAVKSMVMFGCKQTGSQRANSLDDNVISASMLQPHEIGKYLDAQNGTSLLDNFIHKLLVKCNAEFLEQLLRTLQSSLEVTKSTDRHQDTLMVVKRFIRAVIRVYVILSACTGSTLNKKKGIFAAISKCKRVFVSMNLLATQELASTASTIFAPVRMGVVYPSAPFALGGIPDSAAVSDDLFSVTPLPERSSMSHQNHQSHGNTHRVRFAEQPVVEEGHEDEANDENVSQSQGSAGDDSQSHQESDMDIDLLAESDSDSEESNSGDINESQNSNTGNTSSSGRRSRRSADGYFSTTENSETDGEEEEVDEEDEEEEDDDDEDDDENENNTDGNEQRIHFSNASGDSNSAPHALQWAVRSNQVTPTAPSTTAAAHVSGSGLVFIDTAQLRRSAASASNEGGGSNSVFCTPAALARTFAILVREVSDLLCLTNDCCNLSGICLFIDDAATDEARKSTDQYLLSTWQWLWKVMETTEAQLRFGASLTAVTDPSHPQHPLFENQTKAKVNPRSNTASNTILRSLGENRRKKRGTTSTAGTGSDTPNARQEYLSYILSLMRSHESEHGDSLPKVEITSLRHVAYILDAFIYYLRSNQPVDPPTPVVTTSAKPMKTPDPSSDHRSLVKTLDDEEEESEVNDTDEQSNDAADINALRHKFFKRSDSTLVLGYEPTDPYTTPLKEALPLADRPHLLNPSARRDLLFGVVNNTNTPSCPEPRTCMKHEPEDATPSGSLYLKLPPHIYLGRWRMCLELFGRVFLDDVGTEPNSVLTELGRFDVKETKFRREMEKLRSSHQKDLYIEGLDRSRPLLLQQSLKQLNSQFGRRLPGAGPLNIKRVKVSFKEEQGEGTGVARSFYTAISNALCADENLPRLDNIFSGSRGLTHQLRARAKERERERRRNSLGNPASGMIPRVVRRNDRSSEATASEIESSNLSADAPVYNPLAELDDATSDDDHPESSAIPLHKRQLGKRIYRKLQNTSPEQANKITGMLLELTATQLMFLLTHDELFKDKVAEALELLSNPPSGSAPANQSSVNSSTDNITLDETEEDEDENDSSPLFFQPGKPGYYSPRPGKNSTERLNCMRNTGRVVGLCLLQNETGPLSFNRHVIKYLLGKKISWHDLAFFDPTLYESLRHLMEDAKRPDASEFFTSLDLTYCVQLRQEEGGATVELVKGGSQVEVAPDNVYDYVRKYAEYRMVILPRRALQAMRRGLLDVIPAVHLDSLTAEDFRLLLNGAGDINVQQLMGYTFFNDETGGEGQDKLTKFKKWFWSVFENMTPKQKQDLLYFWTSSPAMPASAEGFQPMPSITVKPANDHQLPTANTCISRLYVPLYSSKAILRSKFLLAIKTKVFGFV